MSATPKNTLEEPLVIPEPILNAKNITVTYHTRGGSSVRAVDNVNLVLRRGETLGLVGESGSGKSSLGKALVQLPPPTEGNVWLRDQDLTQVSPRKLRGIRRRFQMIFQDPISSLNPRRTALEIVAEPLRFAKHKDPKGRALEVLAEVGVDEQMARRRPHQLSGGQCQRISIARAFVQNPEILVCDEPVSALDVSVQAQVLNLLEKMKAEYQLSMVFISHDLAVVSNISDRVAVLYLGRFCEIAASPALYASPRHPYTRLLLTSIPGLGVEREERGADEIVREPAAAEGCWFASRCPVALDKCRTQVPPLVELEPDHYVACHNPIPRQETS